MAYIRNMIDDQLGYWLLNMNNPDHYAYFPLKMICNRFARGNFRTCTIRR